MAQVVKSNLGRPDMTEKETMIDNAWIRLHRAEKDLANVVQPNVRGAILNIKEALSILESIEYADSQKK